MKQLQWLKDSTQSCSELIMNHQNITIILILVTIVLIAKLAICSCSKASDNKSESHIIIQNVVKNINVRRPKKLRPNISGVEAKLKAPKEPSPKSLTQKSDDLYKSFEEIKVEPYESEIELSVAEETTPFKASSQLPLNNNSEIYSSQYQAGFRKSSQQSFNLGHIDSFQSSTLINLCYTSRPLKHPEGSGGQKKSKIEEVKLPNSDLNVPSHFKRTCGCASILIVDDSPFNLLILQEIFAKIIPNSLNKAYINHGQPCLAIDEATNGKHALNKVKETMNKMCCSGYELILMDLNMPVMDGATSSKHIIELQNEGMLSPSLKIIALTAYDSPEHKRLCKTSGMKGFLNKPVAMSDIVYSIEHHSS